MKKNRIIKLPSVLILIAALILCSCGPSANERRQQEIDDSLRLVKERRELLERANRMFENDSVAAQQADDATD